MANRWFVALLAALLICTACGEFEYVFQPGQQVFSLQLVGNATLDYCYTDPDIPDPSLLSSEVSAATFTYSAVFPRHVNESETCRPSLRLTAAQPHQSGGAWHVTKQAVHYSFETIFNFRVSNQSLECERFVQRDSLQSPLFYNCARDPGAPVPTITQTFGVINDDVTQTAPVDLMRTGGDGFAFVIHNAEQGIHALGSDGRGLGYSGIRNSLAVEFDAFPNPGAFSDATFPHIAVHSNGRGVNSADGAYSLVALHPFHFSDTQVHTVRLTLYPRLRMDMLDAGLFSATAHSASFFHPKMRTLCVYVDDLATPQFCVPLDLTNGLDLDSGRAFVGFTAATGTMFQNHDVFEWKFCSTLGLGCDSL